MVSDDPNLLSFGTGPGSVVLNFMYSAPYENDPSKNRPDRFLLEVYLQGECYGWITNGLDSTLTRQDVASQSSS